MKPYVIDLCCGLGGWTKGFLAEGYDAYGFDIERHQYGEKRYPAQLILHDILTLDGRQLRGAACIVASPPCQKYSHMAMPFSRGKREAAWQRWARSSSFGEFTLNALFDACFRIQREASDAAGREIPMVVENVKGAQPWVGRAAWHYGSYYLWGDVPALMPRAGSINGPVGLKTVAHANIRDGHTHTRHLTNQAESDALKVPGLSAERGLATGVKHGGDCFSDPNWPGKQGGVKQAGLSGHLWFNEGAAAVSSSSDSRKAASAQIAEIPFELASWIARCFKP